MKNSYEVEVRLSEDLMRKLLVISAAEGRSVNNQFLYMLRNNIAYYERTKGKFDPKALAALDLSAYAEKNDAAPESEKPDKL